MLRKKQADVSLVRVLAVNVIKIIGKVTAKVNKVTSLCPEEVESQSARLGLNRAPSF